VLLPLLKTEWHLSNYHLSFLGSATFIGMLIGAVFLGRASDKYGRQLIFQLALGISAVFGLISAISPNIWFFTFFRFLLGVGFGGNIIIDVVMLAEMIPVKSRGRFLSSMELFYGVGAVLTVSAAWVIIPTLGWRWMIGLSTVPAFLLFVLRRGMPESARYLVMVNQPGKATDVLLQICDYNQVNDETREKVASIRDHLKPAITPRKANRNFMVLFKPELRLLTISLCLIWFLNSFGSSVFLWLPLHMAEGGQKDASSSAAMGNAYKAALFMALGDVLGSLSCSYLAPYFDRRHILRFGLAVLAFGSLFMGLLHNPDHIILALPAITLFKTLVVAMLYTYTPELYPTSVRSSALGLCSAFHRLAPAVGHWVVAILYSYSFWHVTTVMSCVFLAAAIIALLLQFDTRGHKLASHFYAAVASKRKLREDSHQMIL
jgi:MFS transporter, putative metabolite:H+ symporter